MSKYFSGQSQGSYLPPGFMEAATQSGRLYADAMANVGRSIGEVIKRRSEKRKDDTYFDLMERLGEIPNETKQGSVPGLVERGRPLDNEESKAFSARLAGDRNAYNRESKRLKDLIKDETALLKEFASSGDSAVPQELIDLFKKRDKDIDDLRDAGNDQFIEERLDPEHTLNAAISSPPKKDPPMIGPGSDFRQYLHSVIGDPSDDVMAETELPPVQTDVPPDPAAQFLDESDVMARGLKAAKRWARQSSKNFAEMAYEAEDKLSRFQEGRELIPSEISGADPTIGGLLMEPGLVPATVGLSEDEQRDLALGELSKMARSMGRERFAEASAKIDKLFPDKPDIETVDLGSYSVITEDGKYKAAIKTPNRAGNTTYAGLSENQQKLADTTYTKIGNESLVSSYSEGVLAYRKIKELAAGGFSGNPISDAALITTFNKVLDPRSIVTEGETRIYQSARPYIEYFDKLADEIKKGPSVSPEMRERFAGAARGLMDAHRKLAQEKIDSYKPFAKSRGIPFELVAPELPDIDFGSGQERAKEGVKRLRANLLENRLEPLN